MTSHNCTLNGAANSLKLPLSSGLVDGLVTVGSSAFKCARCSWTSVYSGELRQVWCQSMSVWEPGAAPMTSSIHSAGLAWGGQGKAPLRSKYLVRIAEL